MRTGREDGASAVEFALVFPLLAMLIFGGLTAGLALDARQQVNHAVRDAARYGATLPSTGAPCGAGSTYFTCVRDRALAAAVGSMTLTRDGLCVSLIAEDDTASTAYFGQSSGSATAPCYAETPAVTGPRVQVRAEREAQLNVVLFHPTITMVAEAVSVYEVDS